MHDRRALAIELLTELSEVGGVPGNEGPVREVLRRRLAGAGELSADRLGGILCHRRGRAERPRVLLDAHLDEVGFLVQSVTDAGFLRMVPVGGWWGHVLPSQRVRVQTRKGEIPGVISSVPPHFLKPEERSKVREVEDLFVDVGASGKAQATGEFGIRPGDPIVPDAQVRRLANPDLLTGKAFDDRAGCALLVQSMLEIEGHPGTLIGAGSVQEEVGCRGAATSTEVAAPDVALVLEGSPADDVPGADKEGGQGGLGKGVQVRFCDPSAISHRGLVDLVLETAESKGIRHQLAVRRSGGTNASRIHLHGRGVPTVVLAVPVRYIHSHVSILDVNDYLSALDLVAAIVGRLDRRTLESLLA